MSHGEEPESCGMPKPFPENMMLYFVLSQFGFQSQLSAPSVKRPQTSKASTMLNKTRSLIFGFQCTQRSFYTRSEILYLLDKLILRPQVCYFRF